jgi:hypothetical protein
MVTKEVFIIEEYQVAEAISKTELFGNLTQAEKAEIFSNLHIPLHLNTVTGNT